LDVRLSTCSGKNIVTKSKEALAGLSEGQLAEASEEGLGSKGAVASMMIMMMMIMMMIAYCIFSTITFINNVILI